MKVRSGWNSEYARKKFDVELDEADLIRILIDNDIAPAEAAALPVNDAFVVLYTSAEITAKAALVEFDPSMKQQLSEEIAELRGKRARVLGKIRDAITARGM